MNVRLAQSVLYQLRYLAVSAPDGDLTAYYELGACVQRLVQRHPEGVPALALHSIHLGECYAGHRRERARIISRLLTRVPMPCLAYLSIKAFELIDEWDQCYLAQGVRTHMRNLRALELYVSEWSDELGEVLVDIAFSGRRTLRVDHRLWRHR